MFGASRFSSMTIRMPCRYSVSEIALPSTRFSRSIRQSSPSLCFVDLVGQFIDDDPLSIEGHFLDVTHSTNADDTPTRSIRIVDATSTKDGAIVESPVQE